LGSRKQHAWNQHTAEAQWNGLDWSVVVNTRDYPPFAQNKNPLADILCGTTIPGFLNSYPTALITSVSRLIGMFPSGSLLSFSRLIDSLAEAISPVCQSILAICHQSVGVSD
jgi:hypothetical protein